ncbi:histone-lysine N-methyltransferase SETMAR [Trichonephila clavata]|uniref:Histone-lysine N-methyltransferase SETMAR n=1 Tax=Trichonephila clavata TaxID=2740835 RepID=A0A8X6G033_TRICU|nr:histone-lysine N-methyltransferase SETMAR [Trichonephila clavata]
MHRRMKVVSGEYILCHSSIVEVRKRFLEGHELMEDDARSGQSSRVITPEMIARVNDLVLKNHRNTFNKIHRLPCISVSTTHTIMHQHFTFRKICTQPDLLPCNFHVFVPLKRAIRGRRLTTDDEVCDWDQAWIRQQRTSVFKDRIDRLVSQWDKCANSSGG